MKKFIMNKNVDHNGKFYAKGAEINEGDEGFKELVQAGHAENPFAKAKADEEIPSEGEQGEQPAEQAKSAGKSKK